MTPVVAKRNTGKDPVRIIVHAGCLRFEIVCREWSSSDLAREANLSPASLSAALAGRPVAASFVALIQDLCEVAVRRDQRQAALW